MMVPPIPCRCSDVTPASPSARFKISASTYDSVNFFEPINIGSEPAAAIAADKIRAKSVVLILERGRVASPVGLDLGQGQLAPADAIGEVVHSAERRVAEPQLARGHALRGHGHPDHVGVRGDETDLRRRLEQ